MSHKAPLPALPRALALALSLSLAASALLHAPSAAAADPEHVQLTIERFQALMDAARHPDTAAASWSVGRLHVQITDPEGGDIEVTLDASLTLPSPSDPESSRPGGPVPLLPADAVLIEARLDGSDASLGLRSGVHTAWVSTVDQPVAVHLRYLVRATATGGNARGAVLPLPPLPGAELRVVGPATTEVWPALDVEPSGEGLRARLPATSGAVLRWGDTGPDAAIRSLDLEIIPDADGSGADVEATYEIRLGTSIGIVRVAPAGAALISLAEGRTPLAARVLESGHHAVLTGVGLHTVTARFRLPVDRSQGQPRVDLALEPVPITHVVAIIPGERDVSFEPAAPLKTSVQGSGDGARTRAEAHLPPSDHLAVRWTETRAAPEELVRVNTETYQLVRLEEAVIRSRAIVRYEVIRGGVRELAVQIPDDAVLYRVSGTGVDDWRTFAASDEAPRQARVWLAEEAEGSLELTFHLETPAPTAEGSEVELPLLRPLGAWREGGVIALLQGPKVALGPADAEGYSKVGEDALPTELRADLEDKVGQALKHVGAPGPIASTVVRAPERDVRFDARVHALYRVKEGALEVQATVLVELKSGRRDEVILSLPEGVSVLSTNAPSLNVAEAADAVEAGEGRKAHRVRFTRALEGAVEIDLELEMLLPKDLGTIVAPDIRVLGAEVEEGALGVVADTGIEVRAGTDEDVRRVDGHELPRAVRLRTEDEVLLGYTWARAPWSLELQVRRHRTVETLDAVARGFWLETTVLSDGHLVTHAMIRVANADRQFLRFTVPGEDRVWAVAVDGQTVKAVSDDQGALAIPLPKDGEAWVEVVWESPQGALGLGGSVDLEAPRLDLLVTDLRWLVRIPEDIGILSADTQLETAPSWRFHTDRELAAQLDLPFAVGVHELFEEHLWTRSVLDPSEEVPTLSVSYVVTPGSTLGYLLGLLVLLMLLPPVRRAAMAGAQALVQRIRERRAVQAS